MTSNWPAHLLNHLAFRVAESINMVENARNIRGLKRKCNLRICADKLRIVETHGTRTLALIS